MFTGLSWTGPQQKIDCSHTTPVSFMRKTRQVPFLRAQQSNIWASSSCWTPNRKGMNARLKKSLICPNRDLNLKLTAFEVNAPTIAPSKEFQIAK